MIRQLATVVLTTIALYGCAKHKTCLKEVETTNPANPTSYPLDPSIPCEPGLICTAVYADIQVTIQGSKGTNVLLDSFYTEDLAGTKLPSALYSYVDLGGSYPPFYIMFNDYWMSGHRNTTTPVRFIGYKNGIKVVNEPYIVNADCCHISKGAGKDTIIVP